MANLLTRRPVFPAKDEVLPPSGRGAKRATNAKMFARLMATYHEYERHYPEDKTDQQAEVTLDDFPDPAQ